VRPRTAVLGNVGTLGDERMKAAVFFFVVLVLFASPSHGEMYRWVDGNGTVHFTDDPSSIPEKYRSDAESRKTPKDLPAARKEEKPAAASSTGKPSEPEGIDVPLARSGEVWVTEVTLNGRTRQPFIVDTGASFTLISRQTAINLGVTIDESTPFLPVVTASDVILNPLITLRSVRVGKAEVENIDALVHNLPGQTAGLLGNSFLSKFRVVIDSGKGKMVLFRQEGKPSPDRPGGYGKEYWVGRFQYYQKILEDLKRMKATYERGALQTEVKRVNNSIRYFENQLAELERKASFAGVPRNWRE
jgi:clan AA aspartic protease (TIGR02281 family)